MSIAQRPDDIPYQEYAQVERERDQWKARCLHAEQELAQERQHQQQREWQRRKLWQTKLKPAEKATLEAIDKQLQSPHAHRDEEGFTRITWKTAAMTIGMSDKNTKSCYEKTLAQCPDLLEQAGAQTKTREEYDQELQRNIPRYYLKTERSLTEAATCSKITAPIKQGGNQYQCQNPSCLSHNVRIDRRLVCMDCGHTSELEPTYPNGKLKNAKAATASKTNLSLSPKLATTSTNNDQHSDNENQQPPAFFAPDSGQVVGVMVITSSPPTDKLSSEIESDTDEIEESDEDNQTDITEEDVKPLTVAAELLLEIAGDGEVHIEMSRTGIKKYYQVGRPLQFFDLVDHFKGGQARGASCSYRNGMTRALCFDKDSAEGWAMLQEAARKLVQAGYIVLLDESAAGRGGHLWIIFDALVNAAAARAAVLQIAPELESCVEYWPGPASAAATWNRVRLPGGKYVRYGKHVKQPVQAWCRLYNVATGETAADGLSAARLLLASMTPAEIVPAAPEIQAQDEQPEQRPAPEIQENDQAPARVVAQQEPAAERAGALPNRETDQADQVASAGAGPLTLPKVDARWEQKNGPVERTTLWFAILEEYAASWYNERHSLEEIHPRQSNKMAYSPSGNERTPSVDYYETAQGEERYTDHSQHGRRADGTKDSGDALELASKVEGKAKGVILAETTREIIKQYRAELESAARAGQPIPAEIEHVITPAGRRQYVKWLNSQGEARRQSTGRAPELEQRPAVAIVSVAPEIHTQDGQQDQQPEPLAPAPAVIVPQRPGQGEQSPARELATQNDPASTTDLQTVIQQRGLREGEQCEKCSCPIERDLYGQWVCARCLPAKGYHEYSDLIDQMYPRKQRPQRLELGR